MAAAIPCARYFARPKAHIQPGAEDALNHKAFPAPDEGYGQP